MIIRRLTETTNLSTSDQLIVKYILDNPDCILKYNAKDLAEVCFTSSPTIIRLCKKLGFKGYPDFRYRYIEEYNTF